VGAAGQRLELAPPEQRTEKHNEDVFYPVHAQTEQVGHQEDHRDANQKPLAEQQFGAAEPAVVNQKEESRHQKRYQVDELPADFRA
jgi:hypothetical protein